MKMRLLALSALLLVGAAPPAQSTPPLNETMLLIAVDTNPKPAVSGAALFHPLNAGYEPLVDGATNFTPTRDGKDLLFTQDLLVGADKHLGIVDVASDTLQPRWTYEAFAEKALSARQTDGRWLRLTASDSTVYVASHRAFGDRQVTIAAIDRTDGSERARWDAQMPSNAWGADLSLSPGGTELRMLTHPDGPAAQTLFRFSLPDGTLITDPQPIRNDPSFGENWARRPLPDGNTMFGITETQPGRPATVSFLDLTSATVDQVDLPFKAASRELLPLEDGVSADGSRLYVYAPTLGQVAIVDLLQRRVEQVTSVDARAFQPNLLERALGTLGDLLVSGAEAKTPFVGHLQVAPDGKSIYAVAITAPSDFRVEGVLAIDTQTWQVKNHWLQTAEISDIFLSSDGSTLFVQELPWSSSRSSGTVHVLDTTTGAEVSQSTSLQNVQLRSITAEYLNLYGSAPAVPAAPPLPRPTRALTAELSAARVIANEPIQLEVRVPEAPSAVTANLLRGDVDVALELQPAEPGVFRATFSLPQPTGGANAAWSVQAVAQWPDGVRRRVELRDALFVRPSFTGSDGRAYVLELSGSPRVNVDSDIQVSFVDAATGSSLPDDVSLDATLPKVMELAFFNTGSSARVFDSAAHGVYRGQIKLWSAGEWRVYAAIPRQNGVVDSLLIGDVTVQP